MPGKKHKSINMDSFPDTRTQEVHPALVPAERPIECDVGDVVYFLAEEDAERTIWIQGVVTVKSVTMLMVSFPGLLPN